MLSGFFKGWSQSRINEEGNRVLRDCEQRENASKVICYMRQWSVIAKAELIESYGRKSVVADSQAQCPPTKQLERLFRPTEAEPACKPELTEAEKAEDKLRREWEDKIDAVTGKKKFDSYTPCSRQEYVAELSLIVHLREGGLWHLANDAWRSAFVPPQSLCREKLPGECFLGGQNLCFRHSDLEGETTASQSLGP
eukprot:TRINITY_DN45974_c0_g1_i1.p1 TRINITY_DN45974_c0_g1~~TRINITY_DN45974_c0_g1_i1.p1  ORF type:complete len:214 (+),score=48.52 TRINITY_DN45974_c0_g1_i1:55-642(+)